MKWMHEWDLTECSDICSSITYLDHSPRRSAAVTTALSLLIAFLNEILWDDALNIGCIFRISTNKNLRKDKGPIRISQQSTRDLRRNSDKQKLPKLQRGLWIRNTNKSNFYCWDIRLRINKISSWERWLKSVLALKTRSWIEEQISQLKVYNMILNNFDKQLKS